MGTLYCCNNQSVDANELCNLKNEKPRLEIYINEDNYHKNLQTESDDKNNNEITNDTNNNDRIKTGNENIDDQTHLQNKTSENKIRSYPGVQKNETDVVENKIDSTDLHAETVKIKLFDENYLYQGMENLGNTCYMNSILQIYRHFPFLDNDDLKNHIEKRTLWDLLISFLIAVRQNNSDKTYKQRLFYNKFIKIFPDFKIKTGHDPLKFFINLNDKLSQEFEKNEVIHNRFRDSLIISFETIYACPDCDQSSTMIEEESSISIYLSSNDKIYVSSLLESYFKNNLVNNYFCSFCQKLNTFSSIQKIIGAPDILVINLQRFSLSKRKSHSIVQIDEELNLSNFSNDECIYKFLGCSNHLGSSIYSGHSTAYVNVYGDEYVEFNDKYCQRINKESVLFENMNSYILFYLKESKN